MDMKTYETVTLYAELIGENKNFLVEGMNAEILFIEGNPVTVDVPAVVELDVTDTSDGIKGDTANNPTKPATLVTGLVVQVPLFVKIGDKLKINTAESSYSGRAN